MGVVALTLKLIYSHCLIRFNISSENNDFGFNSIQKIIFFQKISHLNAIGSKFKKKIFKGFLPYMGMSAILVK